jgi:hypothetical protein
MGISFLRRLFGLPIRTATFTPAWKDRLVYRRPDGKRIDLDDCIDEVSGKRVLLFRGEWSDGQTVSDEDREQLLLDLDVDMQRRKAPYVFEDIGKTGARG